MGALFGTVSLYGRDAQTFSLVISLLALLLAGGAVLYARRQAGSADQQVVEAKRANDLAVAELERSIAANARLEALNRIRWEVQSAGGPQLVLRHMGTETAHDVRAWTPSASFISGPTVTYSEYPRERLSADTITPGSSIRFSLARSPFVGEGNELMVTWRGQPDPVAVPLP